ESLALAEATRARYAMGQALLTLGDCEWRRGRTAAAARAWARSLLAWSEIGDRRGVASALERLAWSLSAARQFESAAWLFGATDSQQRSLGIQLRFDEQADHEELLDATRTWLGDAFLAQWSNGAASTLEDAVARALDL